MYLLYSSNTWFNYWFISRKVKKSALNIKKVTRMTRILGSKLGFNY